MKKIFLSLFATVSVAMFSQQGKDGAPLPINASVIVNSYTTLSVDATAGTSTITVAAITGLAGGTINTLTAGDLIMIIQMQGAVTNVISPSFPYFDPNSSGPYNSTYGGDTIIAGMSQYNNAGNNEYAEISSISGTTLTLSCVLKNNYLVSGKTQIIRVPRYTSLTITGTGTITCPQWMRENGYGGVIALEVHGNTTIDIGGRIDASGLGFRGGSWPGKNTSAFGSGTLGTTTNSAQAINKGESIAGDTVVYAALQAKYGRGAIANGGGGGSSNNSGGGGGANGGVIAAWTGTGNPDRGPANAYDAAWNLEPIGVDWSLTATSVSSGGGRGGYSYSKTNTDPTLFGPGHANWTIADQRRNVGGLGGHPLDYSTGKLFLGGGGGSGDGDNNYQGAGGDGGGLIYFLSYGTITGSGQINANGADGQATNIVTGGAGSPAGRDGAGGAGGGGAIVVNSTGSVSGISISANGGKGGDQLIVKPVTTTRDAYGPGGGGGGGYVGLSSTVSVVPSVNGGNNGIHNYVTSGGANANGNNLIESLFPPNGATKGGVGGTGAVSTFSITTTGATICSGNTAVLTAALNGTVPGGTTINWYTDAVGGSPIATGTSYTTTTLTADVTYYVGTCPGIYREPVTVTVTAAPLAPVVTNESYCLNETAADLSSNATASGTNTLQWWGTASSGGAASGTAPTPVTTATGQTIYYVSQTNGSCGGPREPITVDVLALPLAPTTSPISYCQNEVSTDLTATATNTLLWWGTNSTGGTSTPTLAPSTSTVGPTTYYVSQTNGTCESPRASIVVTINAIPSPPTVLDTVSYCQNEVATQLTPNGIGINWYSDAAGTISIAAPTPVTASTGITTYYVSQTVSSCESLLDSVKVAVNTSFAPPSANDTAYCVGTTAVPVNATGTGTLNWYLVPSGGSTIPQPTPSTASAAVLDYYVSQGTGSCESGRELIQVTINAVPSAPVGNDIAYCLNDIAVPLTTTGGTNELWYTSSTGGIGSATAPTPITSSATPVSYFVSQTVNGCESLRDEVIVTTNAIPSAPTVVDTASYCQNESATQLTPNGIGINWYSDAAGTISIIAPTPNTNAIGVTTYYVSQTQNSCESPLDSIKVVVNTSFAPPFANDTAYCVGATAVPVNATGTGTLNWYLVSSGGSAIPQPTPSTASATVLDYYVSQGTGSCESGRELIQVTINAVPSAPVGNDISYCLNDIAVPLTTTGGTNELWYTSSTGGTGSATAPTPITSSATPVSYFVSQTVNGCESTRDEVIVTTNAIPSAPTVVDTASYCQNESATQLTPNGIGINWYSDAAGTISIIAPTPNTSAIGITTYYVSQTQNSCESPLDSVKVVVNTTYAAPTAPDDSYCVGELASPVNVNGTAVINWYTSSIGGTTIPHPTPSTTVPALITYYVSQGSGSCESPREQVDITINALPLAPTGTDVTYCLNETPVILTASGTGTLNWYTVSTGGTASLTAFTPSTSSVGNTDYYVSQTEGTCEGPRDIITVSVTNLQAAPTASGVDYCIGATASTLTATGTSTLNWWGTSPTGGVVDANAPTPLTTAAGTTTYYVSQGTGACESPRTPIAVIVHDNPIISFIQNNTAICATACVQFTQTVSVTGATLSWNFGDGNTSTSSNPTNCYANAGVYNVSVVCTSAQGCVGTSTVNNAVVVSPGANAQISVSPGTIVSLGETISFVADTGLMQTSYVWSFADPGSGAANSSTLYNPSHTFGNVGTYCVTLTAGVSPCADNATVCVEVIKEAFITIPNIFTPNNDGLNDEFTILSSGITNIEGSIYDRWGLKVFSWSGLTTTWDGENASDGVYYYIIQATDYKKEVKTYNGYTQLLAK